MKCKKTFAQELVHWRSVVGDGVATVVAAQDMRMFCKEAAVAAPGMKLLWTKTWILLCKERKKMAVMTTVACPTCLQCQAPAAGHTNRLAPIQQQMNLKKKSIRLKKKNTELHSA